MSETDIAEDVRGEDAIINSMCLTWRHDFGLQPVASGMMGSGMTDWEREYLRHQMRQIYRHHLLPAILAERDRCAGIVEASIVSLDGCSINYAGPKIAAAIRSGE